MIGENIKMIQKMPELDLAGVLNDAGYTCRRIIRGKIKDKIIEVVHGFDLGRTIIWDEETGEDYTICFQNENLYVYKGTEPTEENVLITAPELISVFCRLDKMASPIICLLIILRPRLVCPLTLSFLLPTRSGGRRISMRTAAGRRR